MKHFVGLVIIAMLSFMAASLQADECLLELGVGDNLAFSQSEINIPRQCEQFTITLSHKGSLPAAAMGHNFVVAKTEDLQAIQKDGNKAGLDGSYLKSDDERVIVASSIVGGGESVQIVVRPEWLLASAEFSFFCTVMSHSVVMKGLIQVSD
jgi:azurin